MNSIEQFEAIVRAHYQPLYRFAFSLTRSAWDASDLTQHTFYVWATKGHQLQDISKVKSWLFTTLHRAFLMMRLKKNRHPHENLDAIEETSEQPPAFWAEFDTPDSSQVLFALAKVDEIYRAPVALYYLNDCSYKEISAILHVPLGTVKSCIARGISQLRVIFGENHSCDPAVNR